MVVLLSLLSAVAGEPRGAEEAIVMGVGEEQEHQQQEGSEEQTELRRAGAREGAGGLP